MASRPALQYGQLPSVGTMARPEGSRTARTALLAAVVVRDVVLGSAGSGVVRVIVAVWVSVPVIST